MILNGILKINFNDFMKMANSLYFLVQSVRSKLRDDPPKAPIDSSHYHLFAPSYLA